MLRRTKIVATLGPSTDAPEILAKIFKAGVDVVRINCSHGTTAALENRINLVRTVAEENNIEIAILLDLQGPKIRISKFKPEFDHGRIVLQEGQQFILDTQLGESAGDTSQVGVEYKNLPNDLKVGNILLLDDGKLTLEVKNINKTKIICEVIIGGVLSNSKGINLKGGGLSATALTVKDEDDIKLAGKFNVDYVAISFPRSAADIDHARTLLEQHNSSAGIISKIERGEALEVLDDIIKASDGVMVARGDLGVEIGYAELPAVQKRIIARARALDKIVITATQMMESMIDNNQPTRAEVFDVANAVIDGTDAVMLSAETATGKHPVLVVEAMAKICEGAERYPLVNKSGHRIECTFSRADEAIAMATMYVANHLEVKAIIALTETGATPLWMSRIRSGIPIYALSRFKPTRLKMKLFRGVYPVEYDATQQKREEVNLNAVQELVKRKAVKDNDWIVLARGDFLGIEGGCNTMKILKVGEVN